jgi:hypothetical protein
MMSSQDKQCPKCQHLNFRVAAKCKNPDGCGHVFFTHVGRKGWRKPKVAPVDDGLFSAGLTNEGGLLAFWYGKGEFTKFSQEETALIRRALALPPADPAPG